MVTPSAYAGRIVIAFLFVVLLFPFVSAALIHGTVYDLELRKLSNAVVEISSTPKQRMVAANGTYEFTVDKGTYVIRAQHKENTTLLTADERVVIKDEKGSYVFDLFLFPGFESEEDLLTDVSIDVENIFPEQKSRKGYLILGGASVLVLLVIFLFYKLVTSPERRKKAAKKIDEEKQELEQPEEDIPKEDLASDRVSSQVVALLQEHDNRMTQKELRKNLPLSEAKISLVLSDLKAQGKIRKIKKGRGNIIVLSTWEKEDHAKKETKPKENES